MPADGVPGESRDVGVQLLKTVNDLTDGTREWRNCFLATARGLGFETSAFLPCVLVLRSTQRGNHGVIGGGCRRHLWAVEMKFGNKPSRSLSNVSPLDTGRWEILQPRSRTSS